MAQGSKPGADKGPAATASRALAVFEAIADADRPLNIAELIEATDLPKATLHRMIQVLAQHGMIRADPVRRAYSLGPKIYELTHRTAAQVSLPRACEGELLRLAALTGYRAHCGALRGAFVVYLSEPGLSGDLQRYYATERFLPVHCTSIGKAILASVSPTFRSRMLTQLELVRYTGNTITDRDALEAELEAVRNRGYAIDNAEMAEDLRCIAAPLFDESGAVIAAIGISAEAGKLSLGACQDLAPEILRSAQYISRNLGVSATMPTTPARKGSAASSDVEVALASTAFLGEGPIWSQSHKRLAWVDILEPSIHQFDPATGRDQRLPMPAMITSIAFGTNDCVVAAMQNSICAVDLNSGATTEIARPEGEPTRNRFNDGRVDPQGRYWVGSMSMVGEGNTGGLFRLNADNTLTRVLSGIGTANGLGWSPDGRTMYFTDTMARTIYRFDFDAAQGELTNKRQFAVVPDEAGRPDGLSVDSEGRVWSAHWDGWRVTCYAPDGGIERVVNVPVPRPTSCAFGGEDLKGLYITTARVNMTAEQLGAAPLSGSLLYLPVDVPGVPENTYLGGAGRA